MDTNEKYVPWQYFPEKIIRFASKFENTDDELERLIGYLLLDVGIESLLKTYVLDSSLKYGEKEASTKGVVEKDTLPASITAANFDKITFHKLIQTVREAGKSKITDNEFKSAEHYHGIRNIIYHEGKKTIPSKKDFEDYLVLAKSLLHNLIGVEWDNPDQQKNPFDFPEDIDREDAFKYFFFFEPQKMFSDLHHDISLAIAIQHPKYATRGFEEELKNLWLNYSHAIDATRGSSVYQIAESELINDFNKLTGQNLDDAEFILEICDDVTVLQLGVLLAAFGEEAEAVFDELDNYIKFRNYSMKHAHKEEITHDVIEKMDDFINWVKTMQKKINLFIEEKVSKS